jgi:hypothetical protein
MLIKQLTKKDVSMSFPLQNYLAGSMGLISAISIKYRKVGTPVYHDY